MYLTSCLNKAKFNKISARALQQLGHFLISCNEQFSFADFLHRTIQFALTTDVGARSGGPSPALRCPRPACL